MNLGEVGNSKHGTCLSTLLGVLDCSFTFLQLRLAVVAGFEIRGLVGFNIVAEAHVVGIVLAAYLYVAKNVP